MKQFLTLIILSVISISVFAQQEALVPLKHHPKVNSQTNEAFLLKKSNRRVAAISLPFFDDFYQPEIFPDPALWQDNFVYINTTYPLHPITIGVATFDGTDNNGNPYQNNRIDSAADKLTSNPIDLSGLTQDSSVFLSFFYVSGEYGEMPSNPNDSLAVQFLDTSGAWINVWRATVDTVTQMRQVFVRVDSQYLYSNFQFRFQSFGDRTGANDTWHIDYVKLDKNRDTAAEHDIKDMAYQFLPPSLLKPYYVMPYSQFDTTDLADTVSTIVRNNFINVTTDFADSVVATLVNTGANLLTFAGGNRDFGPLTENVIKYPKFIIPTGLTDDTVIVKVDYSFTTSAEAGLSPKVLANNAVTHFQVFSNFFAYDDGSAERGYWVEDLANYKMAMKYGMRNPDTLRAIKMQLFNVFGNTNDFARFSVCVWKNFTRNSIYNQSDLVYLQSGLKISDLIQEVGTDTINGYYYAPIKPQFLVNGATFPLIMSDTFAIGLIVENMNSLIVGFDRNTNRSSYNFYVDGLTRWRESQIPGTMIINPVVGKALPAYLTPVKEIKSKSYEVKIYPNPTRDQLFVEGIQSRSRIDIYSISGSIVFSADLSASGYIDVRNLPSATYVIRVTDLETNRAGTSKFIKSE
jgi:hypothetical protein